MSGPVDVLRIMDRYGEHLPSDHAEARAAVAELIVRANNAAGALDIAIEYNGQIRNTSALAFERDRLREAIANASARPQP